MENVHPFQDTTKFRPPTTIFGVIAQDLRERRRRMRSGDARARGRRCSERRLRFPFVDPNGLLRFLKTKIIIIITIIISRCERAASGTRPGSCPGKEHTRAPATTHASRALEN